MRDFRDAKAMAQTLRGALAAQGFTVTVSQSLELIAKAFGVADWNTLAAAIRRAAPARGENASPRKPTTAEWAPAYGLSRELELTVHRAVEHAEARKHEFATLEHLLLALIDDADAAAMMTACAVDLGALKQDLVSYIDNELNALAIDDDRGPRPTAAFQRVVQRAEHDVRGQDRDITGADLIPAMLAETESHAVWLLGEHEMTRFDAANFRLHGIIKGRRGPAT
jgi:Glyoxalase superfamily protein/Clp amino terminal domain, pathogenicity island component